MRLTANARTAKLWDNLARHPLPLDMTAIALALLTIPFTIWSCVTARGSWYFSHQYPKTFLPFDVLAPVLTCLTSGISLHLYLSPTRCLHPGVGVGVATAQFVWWGAGCLSMFTIGTFAPDDWYWDPWKAGWAKVAIAVLELIVYLVYMVVAGRALD